MGWVWIGYLLLFAIAIPWYWPQGFRGPLVVGLPLWVAVTLGAIVFLAVWTVWVIHFTWGEDVVSGDGDDSPEEADN